jgi:hypothetical protein
MGKVKKKKGKQRVPTPQTYDAPRDTRQRRTRVGPSCPSPHKATKNTYSSIGFNVFTVAVKIGRKKEIVTLPVCHLPSSTRASTIAFQRKSSTMFGSPSSTLYEYYTGVGVVILSKAVSVTGKSLQLASHGSWNKHCKKCGNFFFFGHFCMTWYLRSWPTTRKRAWKATHKYKIICSVLFCFTISSHETTQVTTDKPG